MLHNPSPQELNLFFENYRLKDELAKVRTKGEELNIKLMRTMAKLSDAEDIIRRWRAELEIVASKDGHNLCHLWIPLLLKSTLGHSGNFPDPDNVSGEEFAHGCVHYHKDIFPDCGFRLKVVNVSEGE